MINRYQEKWESRSSIRTRPRKPINFDISGDFFPRDKQVLFILPEVQALGEKIGEEILLHSLYKYLNDIVDLEIKLFQSVFNKIIDNQQIVNYSSHEILNMYTIAIDEYYHVYIARDMIIQLKEKFTELPRLNYPISDTYASVNIIKERLEEQYKDIFEIIAVSIFETTLVRELISFFDHPTVHPSIKYYINDHSNDESKHYGFFYDLLCYTWKNLPVDYQENIGMHLGDFVKLYLNIESEKKYNQVLLSHYLRDDVKADKLVNDLYHNFEITVDIPIVKNVLSVLKKAGILELENVRKGFLKHNLYV